MVGRSAPGLFRRRPPALRSPARIPRRHAETGHDARPRVQAQGDPVGIAPRPGRQIEALWRMWRNGPFLFSLGGAAGARADRINTHSTSMLWTVPCAAPSPCPRRRRGACAWLGASCPVRAKNPPNATSTLASTPRCCAMSRRASRRGERRRNEASPCGCCSQDGQSRRQHRAVEFFPTRTVARVRSYGSMPRNRIAHNRRPAPSCWCR